MERNYRVVLFSVAAISVIALFIRGHQPSYDDGMVASSRPGTAGITVSVKGPGRSGVYDLESGAVSRSVILLTMGPSSPYTPEKRLLERILRNGDAVELSVNDQQHLAVDVKRMRAREMMLLGIPLHADELGSDDWETLPGIGPMLAQRIVDDRQKNGNFGPVETVIRVPGVGEKKLSQIRKYFY